MERALGWVKETARYWVVLAASVVATLAAFAISRVDRVHGIDFEVDQRLQMQFSPVPESNRVVIVEVSRDDLKTSTGVLAAVPRRLQAELIDGLKRAGAAVALFDLQFDSHPQPTEDPPLREAILHSAPLQVTLCMSPVHQVDDEKTLNGELDWFAPPEFLPKQLPPNVQLGQSMSVFTGEQTGSVQLECVNQYTGRFVDNIALVGYRELKSIPAHAVKIDLANYRVLVGDHVIQIGRDAELVIHWAAADSNPNTKDYGEALDILRKGDQDHFFRGKVVVIGNPLGDPLVHTVNGDKTGLEMVAAAVNTLIHARATARSRVSEQAAWSWAAFVALAMALAASIRKRRRAIGFAIVTALAAFASPVLVARFGVGLLQASPAVVAAGVGCLLGFIAKALIPNWYPMPATGQIQATVLVVDIKDSTPLFERLGAKEGSELIAAALDVAAKAVTAQRGEVIHSTGDGFIALFRAGSPADHTCDGIAAAIAIVERPATESGVEFRAGIETGLLDQGRRGFQGLPFHYATRLEGLCTLESQKLLIGPTAATYSSERFRLESIGPRKLKGIRLPIEPHRVVSN